MTLFQFIIAERHGGTHQRAELLMRMRIRSELLFRVFFRENAALHLIICAACEDDHGTVCSRNGYNSVFVFQLSAIVHDGKLCLEKNIVIV